MPVASFEADVAMSVVQVGIPIVLITPTKYRDCSFKGSWGKITGNGRSCMQTQNDDGTTVYICTAN